MRTFFLSPLVLFYVNVFAQKADTLEYAPGYPTYTVSQADQMKSFPSPRYSPTHPVDRNFSWYDFLYMSYDYSKVFYNEKTKTYVYPDWNRIPHADAAIALNREMYDHWNFYFNIPTPTYNYNSFANPKTFPGAIAAYANANPQMQVCTYIFWPGVNPSKAGFDSKRAYVFSNANIDPCADTSFLNIAKDGITQRKNLEKLIAVLPDRALNRKIDFINENGEKFGEAWTPNAEGYRGNKMIDCIQPDSGNARALRARWQYHVFNTYKKQFMGNDSIPGLKETSFSFYQVSGFLPLYYSEWKEMRYINSPLYEHPHSYYSTPDFYPGMVDHNIFDRYAAYHGIDCIATGRNYEISCGDNYFSPFMCGGWFADSMNYRPAEWLAASKAMCAMGADFFYGAYFNTVNPSQKIPNDPRGYIYQVAMLSYAQAITSHYADIFYNSSSFDYQRKKNTLCIVRKENAKERYVIDAAVFHDDDPKDYHDQIVIADIGGEKIKVNARKQGSVYIYDKSDSSNVIFYQLDSWHEASHPYYWSKDFEIEAELFDDTLSHSIRTDRPATVKKDDFTQFTTYIQLNDVTWASYNLESRTDSVYYIWIRARIDNDCRSKQVLLNFRYDNGKQQQATIESREEFKWLCVKVNGKEASFFFDPQSSHVLEFKAATGGKIDIDKILLSREMFPVEVK
ncbi:MAG: hypothetical protein HY064_15085 [Bacteroidetes bacterium]|nr:hypothetical protein [Bacteroidota bacterium]